MKLKLLSRHNCGLCDEAKLQLNIVQETYTFEVEVIDIEQNDQLHETYMMRIPVIKHEDVIIQEGIIDFLTIEAYLKKFI